MKTFGIKTLVVIMAVSILACSTDKQAKLTQLRKDHDKIAEQIKALEAEIAASGDSTNKEVIKTKKVAVSEIKTETFRHFVEIQGKLDGDDNVGVSAKAMGVIDAVYVRIGDKVSKGQLLAKIDDKLLQQNLSDLKNKLAFATDMYNKQKALWDQKIGSEVQYLSAKNNKESLENGIRTLQEQIDMYHVTAPIAGTIGDASLKVGQAVSPGLPIFRVISFGKLKAVAEVAEAYASKISTGDDVIVYFPDLQKEVPASISAASQYINPVTRCFQVEVRLNDNNLGYKANMIAVLRINDYKAKDAVVIGINMLQTDLTGSFVYVAESHSAPVAKKVYIKTGQVYNGFIEVREGLKTGDKLISTGYLDVEDGQAISF
jgi:RND family efflux transporter MFP subunit